jgi:hypothetical protein
MLECADVFCEFAETEGRCGMSSVYIRKDMRCEKKLSLESNRSIFRRNTDLKVPKCEIFHLFDFNDFYGIKSL